MGSEFSGPFLFPAVFQLLQLLTPPATVDGLKPYGWEKIWYYFFIRTRSLIFAM